MEGKIDLDAIIAEVHKPHKDKYDSIGCGEKECMRIAIHQALVLASENATTRTFGQSDGYECWDVTGVDKASILAVEKLII